MSIGPYTRSKSADPEVRLRASELFKRYRIRSDARERQFKWGQSSATVLPTGETFPKRSGQHIDMLQRWVRDQKAQTPGEEFDRYIDNLPVAMATLLALRLRFHATKRVGDSSGRENEPPVRK